MDRKPDLQESHHSNTRTLCERYARFLQIFFLQIFFFVSLSSFQARKERLRLLALETIDLAKDPYFGKNYQGQVECRLCQTTHHNEGNYLTHTQGKRHQSNLARRAQVEARRGASGDTFLASSSSLSGASTASSAAAAAASDALLKRRRVIVGRPGYRVTKQFDAASRGRSLLFQIDYPEIELGTQPRHRFMSAFEQRVLPPSSAFQLLLFAAEPYETIAFKIPNLPIHRDAGDDKFFTYWDPDAKSFALQLVFKEAPAPET